MSAVISECGKYRYVLRRSLEVPVRWYKPMLFIMLNPSTADDTDDDNTIRRCKGFALREGMTHLNVVNLFAFRATDPDELLNAANPIGIDNDRYIEEEVRKHSYGAVIGAWGGHPFAKKRAKEIMSRYPAMFCLGVNKDGTPRHPLFLPKDTPLVEFRTTAERASGGTDGK